MILFDFAYQKFLMYLCVSVLGLSYLEFTELLYCKNVYILQNLAYFQMLFLQICFCPNIFILSSGLARQLTLDLLLSFHRSLSLIQFLSVFFLFYFWAISINPYSRLLKCSSVTYIYVCVYMRVYMYIHTHTYVCVCVYIYIYSVIEPKQWTFYMILLFSL